MAFNGFYRVLQGFMGFYWMLRGSTEFYWVLLGFSGFCCFFTGFYWFILNCSWFYWAFLGFTGFYWFFFWVLLGFSGLYWVLLGFTGFDCFFFPWGFRWMFLWCTDNKGAPPPACGWNDRWRSSGGTPTSISPFRFLWNFFFSSLLVGFCLPIRPRKKKSQSLRMAVT